MDFDPQNATYVAFLEPDGTSSANLVRMFDLFDDPMPTRGDLEGYCGETASALIQLAAMILDPATHLLFSNKLEDNAPIDELRAQGLGIDEAIAELLRRRGHQV